MARDSSELFKSADVEGKLYDPDGYNSLQAFRIFGCILFLICIVVLAAIMFSASLDGGDFQSVIIAFLVAFVILGGLGFVYNVQMSAHQEKVACLKFKSQNHLTEAAQVSKDMLEEANRKLERQMKQLEMLEKAQTVGDVIISNNYAPVVIASTITKSFNTISSHDPELAAAIKTLAGYVESSGNKQAAEYFNELHEQIASGANNKTTLKALWNGLIGALPSIEALVDVVEKVTALFS